MRLYLISTDNENDFAEAGNLCQCAIVALKGKYILVDASWHFFIAASLVVILTPGQDMILVMSRSIAQGSAAGVATAAGVSVGLLGHTVLATIGLGALLSASQTMFFILKLIGAAYLLYLGFQLIRAPSHELDMTQTAPKSRKRLFVEGVVSNISNPKIAIFYFAFLPQFVLPNALHPTLTVFALGLTFACLTFLVKGPVGLGAGALSGWLHEKPRVLNGIYKLSGFVLVCLGVRLALEQKS